MVSSAKRWNSKIFGAFRHIILFVKEREVGSALIPIVFPMQRFGDHNFYETKRQTVFCYLNKMQTSHLQHLACHNTPSWLIKSDGQLYQILNINPRRSYKSSVSTILLLIFVPYRSRGEEHGWLNALIVSQISYCWWF